MNKTKAESRKSENHHNGNKTEGPMPEVTIGTEPNRSRRKLNQDDAFDWLATQIHQRILNGGGWLSISVNPSLNGDEWERIAKRAIASGLTIDEEISNIITDGLNGR